MDYSDYTTTRNFYLTALGGTTGYNGNEISIAGEYRNITDLIGSRAIDSLSGLNLANTWQVSGENSGFYQAQNRKLNFTCVETLNGGYLDDYYNIADGGFLGGNIDGRSGNDTLSYSAVLEGITVNLSTGQASKIIGGITSIENVTGGWGDDLIIGNNQDNILNGGPGNDTIYGGGGNDLIYGGSGNDELYGEDGNDTLDGGDGDDYLDGGNHDDTLITGSGHNTLAGGSGTDKAIVDYLSTYINPANDIEIWVFLQPTPVDPPPTPHKGGSGGGTTSTIVRKHIISRFGGTIEFEGGSIVIPPDVLPSDATISVNALSLSKAKKLLTCCLWLGSEIYEIKSSGETYFGENNYITITLEFDPEKIPACLSPAIHYYDPEQGKWVELETKVEYNEKTGKWLATAKVNHLGKFAVLGSCWRYCQRDRYPIATAMPITATVLVNHKVTAFEAYNIGGYNYFKLRDLAYVLKDTQKKFEINYAGKNTINLITGRNYTPAGGQMAIPDNMAISSALPKYLRIYIDGKEFCFNVYSINGTNYFKLRDIAEKIDLGVTWHETTNIIDIETAKDYAGVSAENQSAKVQDAGTQCKRDPSIITKEGIIQCPKAKMLCSCPCKRLGVGKSTDGRESFISRGGD